MRNRALMTMAVALTAMCSGLLTVMPAQAAGFAALEPKCDAIYRNVTVPKFDFKFFTDVKVWASSSGTTGVFFIESKNKKTGAADTYVVKFEPAIEPGVTVSRRIFQAYGVPHDRLLKEYTDPAFIRAMFDALVDVAAKGGIDDSKVAKFDTRISALKTLFDTKGSAPKKVIVTQFLPSSAGSSSLGDALNPPNDGSMSTPEGKDAARKRFVKALEALNMPHNQKLLGYLFIMDSFLGNGDRLLGPDKNLANVFLAAGADDTPCLVAIDNEAHAPPGSYIAVANYADKLNSQAVDTSRSQKSPKLAMTAAEYLAAVLGQYKDGVTYKTAVGPLWAFNGTFLYGGLPKTPAAQATRAKDKKEALETCDPVNEVTTNSSLKMWVRRMFRTEFIKIINDMQGVFNDGSVTVLNFDYTEDNLVSNPAASNYQTVCHSVIAIKTGGTTKSIKIDWLFFDQYFAEGALFATRDVGNVAAMKSAISTALKGMPTKNTDLVASALEARSQFVSYIAAGADPDSIIDTMIVKNKKEAYAKAVSVSATTFVYVGDHWEPK